MDINLAGGSSYTIPAGFLGYITGARLPDGSKADWVIVEPYGGSPTRIPVPDEGHTFIMGEGSRVRAPSQDDPPLLVSLWLWPNP